MLRPRHQYRLLQAAFVFALIGVAFFGSHQGIRHSEKGEGHAAAGGEKKHPAPFSPEWFTADPVAFGTFLLAFVTGGLAVVTGGLYFATSKIARDTKEASDTAREASAAALRASTEATNLARAEFHATHRPEIVIHSLVPIVDGDHDETVKVMVVYFNRGRGTAKNIERYGCISNIKIPLSAGIEPPLLDSPLANMEPGEKRTLLIESSWPLEVAQFAATSAPTIGPWLICIGRIKYRDGAGISRETGFSRRLHISPDADEWLKAERWMPVENSEYEYSY